MTRYFHSLRHTIALMSRLWLRPFLAAKLGAVALSIAWLLTPAPAHAISSGCSLINSGVFNLINAAASPASQASRMFELEQGEVIEIVVVNLESIFFTINGNTILNQFPATSGSATYKIPSDGVYDFYKSVIGSSSDNSVIFSCTPAPVQPSTNNSTNIMANNNSLSPQEINNRRRTFFNYNYFSNVGISPESIPSPVDLNGASPPGGPLESHHLMNYLPSARSTAPWPVESTAFVRKNGYPAIGGQRFFTFNGMPMNLWGRVRGSILDGSLGRSGAAGLARAGLSVGVHRNVDLGLFGHIVGGRIASSTLNGSLRSIGGGIGGYMMIHLPSRFRLGFAGTGTWGTNRIAIAGATGNFASQVLTFDASLARPFDIRNFIITPMALLTYTQARLAAYVDSTGVAVPATRDSSFAAAGVIDIAYPILRDGNWIRSITPRLNVRTNVFALQNRNLALGGGLTTNRKSVTFDLLGGIGITLQNGGNLDIAIGATGLAGDVRAYTLRTGLRLPLN